MLYVFLMVAVPVRGTTEPCIYWAEDFESYAAGDTIDGKDTSWQARNPLGNGWTGLVVVDNDGDKALWNRFVGGCAWGEGEILWWNDTGHMPTGSQVFTFSVKPNGGSNFNILFYGIDGTGTEQIVVELDTDMAGSGNSLDMYDSTNGWISDGVILSDEWNKVAVQLNFDALSNPFSVQVNDGAWYGPFSNGSPDCISLYKVRFFDDCWSSYTTNYDDFCWTVPEPATLLLLCLGGMALVRKRSQA